MSRMMEGDDQELLALEAMLDTLIEILVGKEVLSQSHRRLFEKLRSSSGNRGKRVQLRVYEDKYAVDEPDIDCASLLHLCQARCCSFGVALTVQDLEEGELRWKWDEPYMLERGDDGYCANMDRERGGCRCYEVRPATCRRYDCRQDKRVWLDWEQRVPAPMPEGVKPPGFEE